MLYGRWVLGISRDSTTLTWPWAMSPHTCHIELTVETGGEGRKTLTNRLKMCRKLLNPTTRTFQGLLCWNTLVEWQSALCLQYHMNTADCKHQSPFIVNFVVLHLTAMKNSILKICIYKLTRTRTGIWGGTFGNSLSMYLNVLQRD